MRLALIGNDSLTGELVRAIAELPGYSLISVYDAEEQFAEIRQRCPQAAAGGAWETLVAERQVDAVIMAGGSERAQRLEQLKTLTQAGMPLLVIHPACDMMDAYNVEMTRREENSVIVPYSPDWRHPIWKHVVEWMNAVPEESGGPGVLQQIVFERQMTDRSRQAVWTQLCRDELLIRRLLGTVANVNAAGAQLEDASYANLSVCFSREDSVAARWSVAPAAGDRCSTVTVVCRHGTARVNLNHDSSPWTFEILEPVPGRQAMPDFHPGQEILAALSRAIQGEVVEPDWPAACLSLETMDNVQRSLRRKRVVDLNTGERTEENTFKGYMAAMGCLVLLAVLAGFFVLAIVEGFRLPMRDEAASAAQDESPEGWSLWWRLWPVYPLIAFLLLQLLVRVARKSGPVR